MSAVELDELAVENFKEYLRIPSVHPDPNYALCVEFLERQASDLELPIKVYHLVEQKPIVIITWIGTDPDLPTILLNSHMDVVPVFRDYWTHEPFGAEEDPKSGNIYGRGAQDMKCVGIQYLEAIRRLKLEKIHLKRTIHVSFMPDEEIGGFVNGMRHFVRTEYFHDLNVGFALDEGVANPYNTYLVFNGERAIWQFKIHCRGETGHGSSLQKNTAGEQVSKILHQIYVFRRTQQELLARNPILKLGDVTSINLTMVTGGIQKNVLPSEIELQFDCRLPISVNAKDFEQMLLNWCKEAGTNVCIEFQQQEPQVPLTKLDSTNVFWMAFKNTMDEMDLKIGTYVFPGGSDSQFIRGVGLPVIGFSPINNTPIKAHAHDEFLNREIFLNGITIYCKLIQALANVQP